jgi:8-oxo-dGTP pyrophosphatase MutT (NUDIX family)
MTVRAAGGLVTRTVGDGELELLIVHRPRYDDWTLPKGKAEPGESDEACALREVEEETSLVCRLGDEVAVAWYEDVRGRPKQVLYFWMTPDDGSEASPQNEVERRPLGDAGRRVRDAQLCPRPRRRQPSSFFLAGLGLSCCAKNSSALLVFVACSALRSMPRAER